jgi:hypothetical protein
LHPTCVINPQNPFITEERLFSPFNSSTVGFLTSIQTHLLLIPKFVANQCLSFLLLVQLSTICIIPMESIGNLILSSGLSISKIVCQNSDGMLEWLTPYRIISKYMAPL